MNTVRRARGGGWGAVPLLIILTTGLFAAPSVPRAGAEDAQSFTAELVIHADHPGSTINRNIYGHFADTWEVHL
jgi:hypothetical protein